MVRPTHDDVIEHGDAHDFPRLVEAAGYGDVLSGWLRIAAWMIVTHDDCHRPGANRISKDPTWGKKRGSVFYKLLNTPNNKRG